MSSIDLTAYPRVSAWLSGAPVDLTGRDALLTVSRPTSSSPTATALTVAAGASGMPPFTATAKDLMAACPVPASVATAKFGTWNCTQTQSGYECSAYGTAPSGALKCRGAVPLQPKQ